MASRTFQVPMVLTSRSLRGCSAPRRTSALAAKCTTTSCPCKAPSSAGRSGDVAALKRIGGVLEGRAHKELLAGDETVKASHFVTAFKGQVTEVTADKTGATGHEDLHDSPTTRAPSSSMRKRTSGRPTAVIAFRTARLSSAKNVQPAAGADELATQRSIVKAGCSEASHFVIRGAWRTSSFLFPLSVHQFGESPSPRTRASKLRTPISLVSWRF